MELHHALASSIQAAVFPSKQQVNESKKNLPGIKSRRSFPTICQNPPVQKLSKHGKGFWKVAQIHVKLTSRPTAHLPHVGQKQKSVELAAAAVQEGKQPESAGPARWRVANSRKPKPKRPVWR